MLPLDSANTKRTDEQAAPSRLTCPAANLSASVDLPLHPGPTAQTWFSAPPLKSLLHRLLELQQTLQPLGLHLHIERHNFVPNGH